MKSIDYKQKSRFLKGGDFSVCNMFFLCLFRQEFVEQHATDYCRNERATEDAQLCLGKQRGIATE